MERLPASFLSDPGSIGGKGDSNLQGCCVGGFSNPAGSASICAFAPYGAAAVTQLPVHK